jgi:putative two-component system response regulator
MTPSQFDTFGLHVLCIDDSKSQLMLYKSQLEGMYSVTCALAYQDAVACLTAAHPDLIILDMEMPQVSGLEFLDILRFTPSYADIPVIIVSGDNNPADVKEAFIRGASDYVRKPYDIEELILRMNRIFHLIALPRKNKNENGGSGESAKDLLLRSIADLASARDNEKTKHLARVALYAEELAKNAALTVRLRTVITDGFVGKIAEMAALHDIGKVNVPEHILHKTGALTERELALVRRHPADGARTADMIRASFPAYSFLDFAGDIILYHHERWDGKGYPEGRLAEKTPLSARIVALADMFDAVTTKRVYREAIGFDEACLLVEEGRGNAFDPDLVDAFSFGRSRFRDIYDKNRD